MKARLVRRLLGGGLAIAGQPAFGQDVLLEQGIDFSLKPRQGLLAMFPQGQQKSSRIDAIELVNPDDRSLDIKIGLQRLSRLRPDLGAAPSLSAATQPRSRLTLYTIQQELPIGPQLTASFGWHGVKLTNRSANITEVFGDGRLRARDWFLPRAAFKARVGQNATVAVSYTETLRAYGDTGTSGPLGLDRSAFLSLRRALKPETRSRIMVRADWAATPTVDVSVLLYGGRLDDRLDIVGRGTLPINSGSAQIEGAILEVRHPVLPRLSWSLRYSDARLRMSAAGTVRERSTAVAALWEQGPWQVSATLARNSGGSVFSSQRATRLDAGVVYTMTANRQRPLRFSLRFADPDRLASTSFALDDLSGAVRATDRARAVIASSRFAW